MNLTYWRDDQRRRVEIVLEGRFDTDLIIAALQRQREEGVWAYAMLCDARRVSGTPTFDELVRIRAVGAESEVLVESPGPLVIMVANEALFKKACEYAVLAGMSRPINVVADRAEAELWLREQGF